MKHYSRPRTSPARRAIRAADPPPARMGTMEPYDEAMERLRDVILSGQLLDHSLELPPEACQVRLRPRLPAPRSQGATLEPVGESEQSKLPALEDSDSQGATLEPLSDSER